MWNFNVRNFLKQVISYECMKTYIYFKHKKKFLFISMSEQMMLTELK